MTPEQVQPIDPIGELRGGACECGGDLAYSTVIIEDMGAVVAELRRLGIPLKLEALDLPIRMQFLRCVNAPAQAPVRPARPEGCQRHGVKITHKGGLLYRSGRKP